MGFWKWFIELDKKGREAIRNIDSFNRKTNQKCPKCKEYLYEEITSKDVKSGAYHYRKAPSLDL